MDKLQIVDTPDQLAVYQFLARRSSLKLEIAGMKRHGRSAYSICKEVYGLKGNRTRVMEQMNEIWELLLAGRETDIKSME